MVFSELKMKNVTIFMVTAKLSYLILIFLFVRNKEDDLLVPVMLLYKVILFLTIIGVGGLSGAGL